MKVQVRYFASLVDLTGTAEERFDLPPSSTVEQLWRQVVERHASLQGIRFRPLVACDMEYAGWDAALDGVGEVAFLPPVSGG